MLSIGELAAQFEAKEIKLPGNRKVRLRALRARELLHVEQVYPRPVAPLGKDPTRGSLSQPIVNEQDEGYQASLRAWVDKLRCAQIAIAAGVSAADGTHYDQVRSDDARTLAFFEKCRLEMNEAMTLNDLVTLANALHRLADGLLEEAEKNLSGPSSLTGPNPAGSSNSGT